MQVNGRASNRMSVVLATRDGARWVGEQVASILTQEHPVDELVVVDDASRDDTVAEVRKAVAAAVHWTGDLQVVERPAALGVVKNFEDGLARTTGDVVLFSDQDDVWRSGKTAAVRQVFADPSVRAVFSDADEIDGDGHAVGRTLWQATGVTDEVQSAWQQDPFTQQLAFNKVTGATLAIRRSVLDLVLPFPETGYHDAWIALLLTARHGAGAVVALPDRLIAYRVHGANVSGGLAPLGRLRRLGWFVDNGERADALELSQLPLALDRLEAHGCQTEVLARLERKRAHLLRRHALPRTLRARWGLLRQVAVEQDYRGHGGGRLSWLLDLLWYDADRGGLRPVPGRRR